MQKWEYLTVSNSLKSGTGIFDSKFNELGEQGWELVGTEQEYNEKYYVFKRPVQNQN